MTDRQRQIARHMLGLDGRTRRSYRNRYSATAGHDNFETLVEMMLAGHVTGHDDGRWHLTRAAAESVLLPGETLDPEDFTEGTTDA